MFANVLNQITGKLDSRFILTLFFPSLIFWGGVTVVYFTVSGLEVAITDWQAQNADIRILQIILVLAWVTFFAYFLGNQLIWITRQFEGYWDWLPLVGNYLSQMRRKHYQQVLEWLNQNNHYSSIYYGFPFPNEPEAVMPTRLGNILKNAEQYAYQRYDIDAVLLWPRLYTILPDSFIKMVESARASLDFMLVTSGLSALFALISGVYLLVWQGEGWLFLLCFLGGLVVARLAYLSALDAAISYGQLIKSAFDVYKDDLIKQLGYELPKSLTEERKFWGNLYELIYRGEAGHLEALPYAGAKVSPPEPVAAQTQPWVVRLWQWLSNNRGIS